MRPILYSYFRSSCSWRVRISLHLKKIDFEYRPIHLVKGGGQQLSSDYLALNPKGEVPYFIDGQTQLSESMAILFWLEDQYLQINQSPRLLPNHPIKKYQCLQLCEVINSGIQPLQNLKVLKMLEEGFQFTAEQKNQWAKHWITTGLHQLEQMIIKMADVKSLNSINFALGNELSLVDLLIVPQLYNARRFEVKLEANPVLLQIENSCQKLEAFIKASPENQMDFN